MDATGQMPSFRFAQRLIHAIEDRSIDRICAFHHPDIELESVEAPGLVIRGAAEARRHAERILADNDMLAIGLDSAEALAPDLVLIRLQMRSSQPGGRHGQDTRWLLWELRDRLLWRQFAGSEAELRRRAARLLDGR